MMLSFHYNQNSTFTKYTVILIERYLALTLHFTVMHTNVRIVRINKPLTVRYNLITRVHSKIYPVNDVKMSFYTEIQNLLPQRSKINFTIFFNILSINDFERGRFCHGGEFVESGGEFTVGRIDLNSTNLLLMVWSLINSSSSYIVKSSL